MRQFGKNTKPEPKEFNLHLLRCKNRENDTKIMAAEKK
jgi:hypothetical protein